MYDSVNKPKHYNFSGLEVITVIEAWEMNYHLGNVLKYIARAGKKNDLLEDLKKAQWYLNGNLIPIDFLHNQVHEGDVWTLNYLEEALANNGEMVLCGTTGSKTLHVIIEYANGGDGTFKTYTGAVIS